MYVAIDGMLFEGVRLKPSSNYLKNDYLVKD